VNPLLVAGLVVVLVLLVLDPRPPAVIAVRAGRDRRRSRHGVTIAALLVGAAVAVLVGGGGGVAAGLILAIAVRIIVPRLDTRGERRRRDLHTRQAPLVVDLVSACLASGASLEASLDAAASAVGSPTSEVVMRATAALRMGADPASVWRTVGEVEALGALARAAARSQETGAALSDLLPRVADQVRASHRARVEARTRTAAVRLTAPLGAAFLPAFVLLGVVPVVASWVGVLL